MLIALTFNPALPNLRYSIAAILHQNYFAISKNSPVTLSNRAILGLVCLYDLNKTNKSKRLLSSARAVDQQHRYLDMLIDQHRISVGVDCHEERWPFCGFIGLNCELDTLCF